MPIGGGSLRYATGRDEHSSSSIAPVKSNKIPAWIPPSAIRRDAHYSANIENDDEEIFRNARGFVTNSQIYFNYHFFFNCFLILRILNKLTPEKFEKLSIEFCNLPIKSPKVLKGFIVLVIAFFHNFNN